MKYLAGILLTLFLTGTLGKPQQNISPEEDYDYTLGDNEYDTGEGETSPEEGQAASRPDSPIFKETNTMIVVKESEPFEFSCQIINPNNDLILMMQRLQGLSPILLYAGDMKVVRESPVMNENGVFKVASARRRDAGEYQCYYQLQKEKVTKNYTVKVQYQPRVTMKGPSERRVDKGASVTFECKVQGEPVPEITWTKENGVLPSGAKSEKGLSLTLQNVNRHVEGTYRCTANNGIGKPAQASAKLMVEYPPEIITEKAIIAMDGGDKVQLICIVHARPTATVAWTKDGVPLTTEANVQEGDMGHRHSVDISPVTSNDFGSYTCTASNDLGEDSEVIKLTDLPKQPNFTSDPVGGEETKYTLMWETESYYPISEYILKFRPYTEDNSNEWVQIPVEVENGDGRASTLMHALNHTLDDLQPATEYEVQVNVKNTQKWGAENAFRFSTKKAAPTTTTIITTPPPPKPEESAQTQIVEETADLHVAGSGSASMNAFVFLLSLLLVLKS